MKTACFWVACLVAIAALGLVGCEDKNDKNYKGGDVIGTWQFNKGEVYPDGASWLSIEVDENDSEAEGMIAYITFKADGTCSGAFIEDGDPDEFTGRWAIVGTRLTIASDGEAISGDFEVNGDRLEFRTEGDIDAVKMVVITKLRRTA